jgi:hypothetical protein
VILVRLVLAVLCFAAAHRASAAQQPETDHLVFVSEYVRELAAIEDLRASGEQELKQDPKALFSNVIHTSTLFQLELGSQIRRESTGSFIGGTISAFDLHVTPKTFVGLQHCWKRVRYLGKSGGRRFSAVLERGTRLIAGVAIDKHIPVVKTRSRTSLNHTT